MMYLVMGDPPSSMGACNSMCAEVGPGVTVKKMGTAGVAEDEDRWGEK